MWQEGGHGELPIGLGERAKFSLEKLIREGMESRGWDNGVYRASTPLGGGKDREEELLSG